MKGIYLRVFLLALTSWDEKKCEKIKLCYAEIVGFIVHNLEYLNWEGPEKQINKDIVSASVIATLEISPDQYYPSWFNKLSETMHTI